MNSELSQTRGFLAVVSRWGQLIGMSLGRPERTAVVDRPRVSPTPGRGPAGLQITVTQELLAPGTIFSLGGALDATAHAPLLAQASQAYAQGQRELVLDLRDVSAVTTGGLLALYSVAEVFAGRRPPEPADGWSALYGMSSDLEQAQPSAAVRLVNVTPPVARALAATHLQQLLVS